MNKTKTGTRQKIILTPTDNNIIGKVGPVSEHVHILLDSNNGPCTVTLPDATFSIDRELIFKNIGTNNVTIQAKTGQYIDLSTSHIIRPLNLVSVWCDLVKTWWLLDSNLSIELPTYTGNAAAIAAGLVIGDFYRKTASDYVLVVHS